MRLIVNSFVRCYEHYRKVLRSNYSGTLKLLVTKLGHVIHRQMSITFTYSSCKKKTLLDKVHNFKCSNILKRTPKIIRKYQRFVIRKHANEIIRHKSNDLILI